MENWYYTNEFAIVDENGYTITPPIEERHAKSIVKSHKHHDKLIGCLNRALPWLSKALEQEINKDCVMPNDLKQCYLEILETLAQAES